MAHHFAHLSPEDDVGEELREELTSFFFEHLDQFGDPRPLVRKGIDRALTGVGGLKGFLEIARDDDGELVGGVCMLDTGMEGYVPKWLLLFIAVHQDARGQGLGGQLMERAKSRADKGIALHVDMDNPARRLYERTGFEVKYLEMRHQPAG